MRRRLARVAAFAALIGLTALVLARRSSQDPAAPGTSTPPALKATAAAARTAMRQALTPAVSAIPDAPPGVLGVTAGGGTAFFSPRGVSISPPGDVGEAPLRWSVEGARDVAPEGADPLPGVQHFYLGNDPSRWRTGVRRYAAAAYRQLRPGLDVKATPGEGGLQLAITASAEALRDTWFRWEGQASAVAESGDRLVLATRSGTVTQTLDGAVRLAETREEPGGFAYRLEPVGSGVPLPGGFTVGLSWSGYIPGNLANGFEGMNEVHLAPDGTLLVTGETSATTFPISGGFDTSRSGQDAYVAKLALDGSLVWSTFIGGSGSENGEDTAISASGEVFAIGKTNSGDLPLMNAYDGTYGTNGDVYVLKLGPTGALLWSTYLGGGNGDWGLAIGVAPNGKVWVAGSTGSTDFPTTAGAFNTSNPNNNCAGYVQCDGFITELDPAGGPGALLFSSFIGPGAMGGTVELYDLAFDAATGRVYVAGNATSDPLSFGAVAFPPSGVQSGGYGGGVRDGIVLGIDPAASPPVPAYFTYLGGGAFDGIGSAIVDGTGALYLAGRSSSINFPLVPGIPGSSPSGLDDAFVTKLTQGGASIAWSSLLGGTGGDEVRNIALGPDGALYLVGHTDSTAINGFTGPAYGLQDAFVARVSAGGSSLDWGLYLGGSDNEDGRGIDVDGRGNLYVGGTTYSSDFPKQGLPYNNTAGVDGFLVKYDTTSPDGGIVLDGPSGGDLDFQSDTTSLSARWSGFSDPDAPIANYQYAVGTTPNGIDVTGGFLDAGLVAQVTRAASLASGQTYYTTVRAITDAGLSTDVSSDGVTVDATPPDAGAVRDGIGADIEFQRPSDPIAANWTAWSDSESGIVRYEWAIGTTPGGTDKQPFAAVGLSLSASAPVATTSGQRYYVTVKALNGAGGFSPSYSNGVMVDGTPPGLGTVNDGPTVGTDLATQSRTAALAANWNSFIDPESGIEHYEWAIGTTAGGAELMPFTPVNLATTASAAGVTPLAGATYYVTVRAFNGAGDSNQATSNGVQILGTIGDGCSLPGDCASGQCVTGVCCNTTCPACQACNLSGSVGTCAPVSNGTPCPDGTHCNGGETCLNGTCQPGTPVICPMPADGEPQTCRELPPGCATYLAAPSITSVPPATAAVGRQYAYQVTVSGTRPLTYLLCNTNPPGAAMSATGLLTWTPSQAGQVSLCVQVDGQAAPSDSQAFTVTAAEQEVGFGEVRLAFSTDGGTPRFGARLPIAAEVSNTLSVEVRDLHLMLDPHGLALEGATPGAPAGACDQGQEAPVALLPANGSVPVPLIAYVCKGEGTAKVVGHLEREDGVRLTGDVIFELAVDPEKVPVGCDCSGAPGALIGMGAALLWARRRRRH